MCATPFLPRQEVFNQIYNELYTHTHTHTYTTQYTDRVYMFHFDQSSSCFEHVSNSLHTLSSSLMHEGEVKTQLHFVELRT